MDEVNNYKVTVTDNDVTLFDGYTFTKPMITNNYVILEIRSTEDKDKDCFVNSKKIFIKISDENFQVNTLIKTERRELND